MLNNQVSDHYFSNHPELWDGITLVLLGTRKGDVHF